MRTLLQKDAQEARAVGELAANGLEGARWSMALPPNNTIFTFASLAKLCLAELPA
jgi:hypothetical protein